MKINIETDINRESFMVHEHILNGELVYLVQPKQPTKRKSKQHYMFNRNVV